MTRSVLLAGLVLIGGVTMARAQPANPLARAPFAGKWAGDGLALELSAQGGGYAGTLTFQGQAMPCSASAQGDRLSGTFDAGGSQFPFEAVADGPDGLRLTSADQTYALRREGPRNPLTGGHGPGPAGPGPAPGLDGPEVKHPLGVTVRLPAGWTSMDFQQNVLLVPPGVTMNAQSEELHLLMAAPTDPSVRGPGDPAVVQYMDQVMMSTFPNMRRAKEPEVIQTAAGPTAVMDWSGTAPSGKPVNARAYVTIQGQVGSAVLSAGVTTLIQPRDGALRAIAGSMKADTSPANPQLVGKWGNNGGWSIPGNHGQGGAHGSSRVEMTLGQGGQLYEFELRYVQTPAGIMESKEERHGTWSATGSVLSLRYQNGNAATYQYSITNQGLVCRDATGTTTTWLPSR